MDPADPDAVMADHGFPPGLLPRPVTRALFDSDRGTFEVTLREKVVRQVDRFRVRYDKVIRGQIAEGVITGLVGVKAKRGLWFPVTAIEAKGELLAFRVGPVVKHIPTRALS